jgi:hypothetical protein
MYTFCYTFHAKVKPPLGDLVKFLAPHFSRHCSGKPITQDFEGDRGLWRDLVSNLPVDRHGRCGRLPSAWLSEVAHLDFCYIPTQESDAAIIDWSGLPRVKLFGLHECEVYQVGRVEI